MPELVVILIILLLIFGSKRLPELARSLGTSAKELRKGMTDNVSETNANVGEKSETKA